MLTSALKTLSSGRSVVNMWQRYINNVSYQSLIDVHPQVQQALQSEKPIVALESTIITHGMPWPQNLETALEVEDLVRMNGATPATIAILNGRIKVGLTTAELQMLATMKSVEVIKCSRRDLPFLVSQGLCGGTTVAATMLIAHMVGLKIFATGGIGGVHHQGHITMDISADLVELGRTPVAVVCSGVKSILDIPRTLEFLETQGVCIATYGQPGCEFPDFFTTDSGCRVNYNLQTPVEAANLIQSLHRLEMKSGILIGVPIPEEFSADKQTIKTAITKAQVNATEQNMSGKNVTPFLLAAIAESTQGNSLKANIALIKINAATAAKIAKELYRSFEQKRFISSCQTNTPVPLVVGASILDISLTMIEDMPQTLNGATYRTKAKQGAGGVGRNLADGLFKLYGATDFISLVGNDQLGESLLNLMPQPLRTHIRIDENNSTSLCSVIFDKTGDCKLVLGNMEIHENITPNYVEEYEDMLSKAPLIVIDGNLSLPTMECILKLAQKHQKPVFFEPTDMRISDKPFKLAPTLTKQIKIISPNIYELKNIVEAITKKPFVWNNDNLQDRQRLLKDIASMLNLIAHDFDCILVTLGQHGVVLSLRDSEDMALFDEHTGRYLPQQMQHANSNRRLLFFAADPVTQIVNVSGAGDSFSSGFIAGMLRGYTVKRSIAFGFVAAQCALQTITAVPSKYFNDKEEELKLIEETYKGLKKEIISP